MPKPGHCHYCYHTIEGDHKVNNKEIYWRCQKCNLTTSLRFGTIFYNSKLKLINFVTMVYWFTKRNRTNGHTSNKESLPQENFKERNISSRKVNQYYKFNFSICNFLIVKKKRLSIKTATEATLRWKLNLLLHIIPSLLALHTGDHKLLALFKFVITTYGHFSCGH